jgi:hypothetical protein
MKKCRVNSCNETFSDYWYGDLCRTHREIFIKLYWNDQNFSNKDLHSYSKMHLSLQQNQDYNIWVNAWREFWKNYKPQ